MGRFKLSKFSVDKVVFMGYNVIITKKLVVKGTRPKT